MRPVTASTHSIAASTVEHITAFLNILFPEPRPFSVRLWDGTLLSAQEKPRFTLVLNTPGVLRRMFHPPLELNLGEAYIRGDFDVEGELFAAVCLIKSFIKITPGDALRLLRLWFMLPVDSAPAADISRRSAQLAGEVHSKARDRAAIQYHYDVGNDFYALWLDKRMVYSCGYFPTGTEDIDTAQERKLEHICRKLRLKSGDKLLDIGCGWGGLVIYAAQHYGVNALGVTLSTQQAELANRRIAEAGLGDRAEVRLIDYRDLGDQVFDKMVSVGMFEHVGRRKMPEYFAHTYRLLKPGGLFLNHGISLNPFVSNQGMDSPLARFIGQYVVGPTSFTNRYVFPDGELVPCSEVNILAERSGFEVRDVENLREHYALTLRQWVARLEAHPSEAIKLTNEATYRIWKLYMSSAVVGFELGDTNVNQSLLVKLDGGRADVPLSRADIYSA